MISITSDRFWKCYRELWFWIGSRGDYDNLLRQLRVTNEKFL